MTNRSTRVARRPCAPWVPISDPRALTVENLERVAAERQAFAAQREAIVADALAADPQTSDKTVGLVTFAWPYLSQAQRARVLTLVLTDEVRAAATAAAKRGQL